MKDKYCQSQTSTNVIDGLESLVSSKYPKKICAALHVARGTKSGKSGDDTFNTNPISGSTIIKYFDNYVPMTVPEIYWIEINNT